MAARVELSCLAQSGSRLTRDATTPSTSSAPAARITSFVGKSFKVTGAAKAGAQYGRSASSSRRRAA
jgi:hypothetical protein